MAPTPLPSYARPAILIVLALVLGVQAWMLDYVVDDAFISFRYADNLVEGHGLTFNPGGPRVEGYTNLGWTLLMTAPIALGADPRTASLVFGILAGLVTLLLAERLAARLGAGRWSLVAPALLAVNPAMVTWSAGGLETAAFAALVTGGALLASSGSAPRWGAGVLLALACLVRPEGVLLASLIAVGVFWSEGRPGAVRFLPSGLLVLGTVALHTSFRLLYYGTLLPNTFYAKTGDVGAQVEAGLPYVFRGLGYFAGGPLVLVVLALALRRRSTATTVATVSLTGWLLYVALIGGDGLPMYRFLVPALPFLVALAAVAIAVALDRRPGWALAVVVVALLATLVPRFFGREAGYLAWDRTVFLPKVESVGRQLRDFTGPDATIALLPAGTIPYHSRLTAIDMLALNDPEVARKKMRFTQGLPGHWKYDAASVLWREPDYILLGNVDVTPAPRAGPIPPSFNVEADLIALPEFLRDYELAHFQLADGRWLNCYRRRPHAGGS